MIPSRVNRLSLLSLPVLGALSALVALLALANPTSPINAADFAASETMPGVPADHPVITVTNSSDVNNGNVSSVAALLANPGADGVSLREAVLASNNDAGPETITFSPALSGTVITLGVGSFFPFLLGGGLTIDGDLNGHGAPDITLHGSAIDKGLSIWSDDNLVTGLRMVGCDPCIDFPVPNGYSGASAVISGNVISGNVFAAGTGIAIGPLGWNQGASNITWQGFTIANNDLGSGGILFYAGANGLDNNRILSMTLVSNQAGDGIALIAGDTNLPGSPPGYSDGNLVEHVLISANVVGGIKLHAANMGNRDCHVRDVEIVGNQVNGAGITLVAAAEIRDTDGRASHDNSMSNVSIRNNRLVDTMRGISVGGAGDPVGFGGVGNVDNRMENVEVLSNTVLGVSSFHTGIWLHGGMINGAGQVEGNVLRHVLVSGNRVEGAAGSSSNTGIHLVGGQIDPGGANGHVFSNTVQSITITRNTIVNLDRAVQIIGAAGTSDLGNHHNVVSGVLLHGTTISNTRRGIVVGNGFAGSALPGGAGLFDNLVRDLTITDNAVAQVPGVQGPPGIGIWVYGAWAEQETVAARNRVANLVLRNNQVTVTAAGPDVRSLYVVGGIGQDGSPQVFSNTIENISLTLNSTAGAQYGAEIVGGVGSGVHDNEVRGGMADNQFSGSVQDTRVVNNLDGAVNNWVFGSWWLPPAADFSAWPLAGPAPLSVLFANLSTGDYDTCAWTFGDGSPGSSDCGPSHVYVIPGTYTATLSVGGLGGADTETKTSYITVYARVAADFDAAPQAGPAPLVVTFTNRSAGAFDTCAWTFGDGSPASDDCAAPIHRYENAGAYTVSLMVSGDGGSDGETKNNYVAVYQPPAADFTADHTSGFLPLEVRFTNLSTGDYDACVWQFGDGSPDNHTCVNPSHTFTSSGAFTVTLSVSGSGGADSETKAGYVVVKERYLVFLPLLARGVATRRPMPAATGSTALADAFPPRF